MPHQRIEARGRLVEDEQLRAPRHREQQQRLRVLSAREPPQAPVGVEREALQQLFGAPRSSIATRAGSYGPIATE
jgi:hypothetical protein